MNCDQVFSILTRGPFPSGDVTDGAVEAHLSLCSECRHFADALRPDGHIDVESLIPEESRGLPYYWGLAALPAGDPTGAATATQGRRTHRRRKPTFFERHEPLAHFSGWQLAFAVVMGAMLGTLLKYLGYADGAVPQNEVAASTPPASAAMSAVNSSAMDTADASMVSLAEARGMNTAEPPANWNAQLASKLGATPACCEIRLTGFDAQPEEDDLKPLAARTAGSDACCTKCHNASAQRFALAATTAKIVRSCQVCHVEAATSRLGQR